MSGDLSLGRRASFSLILAVFVLFVIEGTCQIVYRLTAGDFLYRRTTAPIFEEDPTRCYRLRANLAHVHKTNEFETAIYTNSQGMRTDASRRDMTAEKPPGVHRILFLGASFTFGWGNQFEDIYPTVVGEILRAEGVPVEVVNLGTPAQGIDHQLCWLETQGAAVRPDVVVQTVSGEHVPTVPPDCPERLECPIIEDSTLYTTAPTLQRKLIAYVKNLGTVFYGYYAYQWVLGIMSPGQPSNAGGTGMAHLEGSAAQPEIDYETMARDFAAYERTIHRIVGEHVPVVFLFVPMSYVVHTTDAARWSHLVEADPIGSRERIQAEVAALRARGHLLVDSTPALIERSRDMRLYYWLDIHPNRAGNRVIAEALAPILRDQIGTKHAQSEAPLTTGPAVNSALRSAPAGNE